MNDFKFNEYPWSFFSDFIDLKSDRFASLENILKESILDYEVLNIEGNRHFFITPPPVKSSNGRRPTLLVAHYDRAKNSPGANDNSAGVFMLIESSIKLRLKKENNWAVIFTDKEELNTWESIQKQGAYTLSGHLKKLGMQNARIFNFDTCGSGDSLIISTSAENILKNEKSADRLRKTIHELQEICLKTARNLHMHKVHLAPTPFGDDIGFLHAGFAAQTITMLPSEECSALLTALRKNPSLADALVSFEKQKKMDRSVIPQTWRNLNGPNDSLHKLSPGNFKTVIRFAEALCSL